MKEEKTRWSLSVELQNVDPLLTVLKSFYFATKQSTEEEKVTSVKISGTAENKIPDLDSSLEAKYLSFSAQLIFHLVAAAYLFLF